MSARTCQPVWRCSYDVGDPRARVFRPIGDGSISQGMGFADAWRETMWAYADHIKAPGQRHSLSASAIHLVDVLLRRFTDWKTGRCEPSIEAIMARTRYARPTVIRLLAVARDLGFLSWVRRTEPTDNAPGYGPAVRQVTNAYFFEPSRLPTPARIELLQRLAKKGIAGTEHPERVPSARLPKYWLRQASSKIRALRSSLAVGIGGRRYSPLPADEVRRRQADQATQLEALENAPRERWPELIYPDNPTLAAELRAEMGLPPLGEAASSDSALQSPP